MVLTPLPAKLGDIPENQRIAVVAEFKVGQEATQLGITTAALTR
jgi:hypothetical protein